MKRFAPIHVPVLTLASLCLIFISAVSICSQTSDVRSISESVMDVG